MLSLALALGLFARAAAAQNLVLNPSFEVHTGIPTSISQLNLATNWDSPTAASPDYYIAGAPPLVNVPVNSFGNQAAHTGQAYAGFHARPTNVYREYVQAPLVAPLVPGQTYQVSFYLSLVDQSRWAIDMFGAYLSVGQVGPIANAPVLSFVPQIANPPGNYITNKQAWTLVSGPYVAAGGEDHIVVGNFTDNVVSVPLMGQGGAFSFAYYYLDDVSVVGVDPPCVDPPSGAVSWWPLDELSGATVVTDIIDGNDGTPQDAPIGQGGPVPGAGQVGGSLSFDGMTDYIQVADAPNLNFGAGDLSIDAWILMPAPATGLMPIVDKEIAGPTDAIYGYVFYVRDGYLGFSMTNDVNVSPHASIGTTDTTTFLADGLWHLVAVSVERTPASATGGQLFVDGAVVATFDTLPFAGLNADTTGPLTIGATSPLRAPRSDYFEGAIDEVEIFNQALTQQDVVDLYTTGPTGKCTPTQGPSPTPTDTRVVDQTPTATSTRTPRPSNTPTTTPTRPCDDPISIDISTGMQSVGNNDPLWSLVAAPVGTTGFSGPGPATVINANAAWTLLPSTQWISANQGCTNTITPDCPGGDYTYEICWEQCGELDASPLEILADNTAAVFVDGNPVVTNPATIGISTPATIPLGGLGTGVHTLRVVVHNNPFSGGGGTATGMDLSGSLNGDVRIVRCADLPPPTSTPSATPTLTPRPSNTPSVTPTPTCGELSSIDLSTGMQSVGSNDPLWSLVAAPVGTTGFSGPGPAQVIAANAAWTVLPNTQWISANQNCTFGVTPDCPGGDYTYEFCWEQCGALGPAPLQILADNTAAVFLDGNPVVTNPPTIGLTTPATIPGFTLGTGTHSLRVVVHNNPFSGGGGTATGMDLRGTLNGSVQVVRCADVPPPTSTPSATPTRTPRPSNTPTITPTPTCGMPMVMANISTGMAPIGNTDPLWTLTAAPLGTVGFSGNPIPALTITAETSWTTLPTTQWISANPGCSFPVTADCPGGKYSYDLCWEQCGALVPAPLQILADNTADVFIDSTKVTTTSTIDFTTPTTIPGFTLGTGQHRLRVDVHNNPFSMGGGTATGMDLRGMLNGSVTIVRCPRGRCVGDCTSKGSVTVDDLIKMVNVALLTASPDTCSAGDANEDGQITIEELVAAVNNALNGCPA